MRTGQLSGRAGQVKPHGSRADQHPRRVGHAIVLENKKIQQTKSVKEQYQLQDLHHQQQGSSGSIKGLESVHICTSPGALLCTLAQRLCWRRCNCRGRRVRLLSNRHPWITGGITIAWHCCVAALQHKERAERERTGWPWQKHRGSACSLKLDQAHMQNSECSRAGQQSRVEVNHSLRKAP